MSEHETATPRQRAAAEAANDIPEGTTTPASENRALQQALAELAKIVLSDQPLGAVLTKVAVLAADVVPGIDEVSVTLIERGRPTSVAFSGQLAVSLDERQYAEGFGPCMDAAASGQTIAIDDTATDVIYPGFAAQAAREGINHTLSIPLSQITPNGVGALNLYGRGQALDQDARDSAVLFSSYATVACANAAVYAGALDEVLQMRTAMASRATIEQAKGIIMGARRCTPDEAFDILRETSSRHNRRLRDIAQALVDTTLRRP
jgi:GAF domain-containing protein